MASTATAPAVAPPSGKTYRTELSPVSFLRRSAFVYPEKVAVVHGE
jgi:fatty-acyl-CoA synthase